MAITKRPFGVLPDGRTVTEYTAVNKLGAAIKVIDLGGTLISLTAPDRDGKLADVVTGFDKLDGYLSDHGYMGETIGRYGNRISKGELTLEGETRQLFINNGPNHLHGGKVGFNAVIWTIETEEDAEESRIIMHYTSADGEENYPGTLEVTVTYTWTDACALIIRYQATTDKVTVCNMTNHSYFNLAGHDHGIIADHVLQIEADAITPTDSGLIPTGAYMPVVGTPFDLRGGLRLGEGLAKKNDWMPMVWANGYDHNFVLRKGQAFGLAAKLSCDVTGRKMEILTDQPGIQVYTANFLECKGAKGGAAYHPNCAVALETQHFPDSPNHPHFPTTTLRPGERYDTTTIYAFGTF